MHMWRAGWNHCWIQQWLKFQHLAWGHKDPGEIEVALQCTLGYVSDKAARAKVTDQI